MDPKRIRKLGVYLLEWESGGHSVASVGCDRDGNIWFAVSNWVSGLSFDWSKVSAAKLIATQDDAPRLFGDRADVPLEVYEGGL